jgi:hypothetical protein
MASSKKKNKASPKKGESSKKNVKPKTTQKSVPPKQKRPQTPPKKASKSIPDEVKKTRNFVLLNVENEEIGRYTGKAPRQAALKVANAGITNIRLRETGVRRKVYGKTEVKIHVFKGSRKQRNKTATDPDWLPDKINYPVVKKKGVEWLSWSS